MGAWELPALGRELPCLLSSVDSLPGHMVGFRCARLPWLVKLSPAPRRELIEAICSMLRLQLSSMLCMVQAEALHAMHPLPTRT